MLVTFNSKSGNESTPSSETSNEPSLSTTTAEPQPVSSRPANESFESTSSSFRVINSTDGVSYFSKRSRNGCLTCKIRKKKCDEGKPSCRTCSRLNKQCVWVDYSTMSELEIKQQRQKVEEEERHLKLRRRKSRLVSVSNNIKQKLDVPSPPPTTPHGNASHGIIPHGNTPPRGITPPILNESRDSVNAFRHSHSDLRSILNHAPSFTPNNFPRNESNLQPNIHISSPSNQSSIQQNVHLISALDKSSQQPNISNLSTNQSNILQLNIHHSDNAQTNIHHSENNQTNINSMRLDTVLCQNYHNILRNNTDHLNLVKSDLSPSNISHEFHSSALELARKPDFNSPNSPSAFLNVLRDLSHQREPRPNDEEEDLGLVMSDRWENNSQLKELFSSSNFSALMDSISFENNQPNFNEQNILSSPNFIDNIIPNLNSIFSPLPPSPPQYISALSNPSYAYLYSYYANTLSQKISIAPTSQFESNSYQNVFLPLAHQDKGVLYGILAWSAFHLSGKWASVGTKLVNLALEHIKQSLTDILGSRDNFQGNDRHACLLKLATLLILCGAEICKGDVKNWSIFLRWASRILRHNGGILNFNKLKEEHWLISNFAYHDVLSSSCTTQGTYFLPQEYDMILGDQHGFSKGKLSPLLGVSKTLYLIIGEISTLNFESKQILNLFYEANSRDFNTPREVSESIDIEFAENDSDISEHKKTIHMLSSIIDKSKVLDKKIESSCPDPEDLVGLTDQEVELQMTLFEAFQISCKLYLMQCILNCNPSMLEIRVLNTNLTKCIDILLESPMQASLVFPIFMAGIHCITKAERTEMMVRMDSFMKLYGPWNIRNVKVVTQMVWDRNPLGDKCVDWHRILEELGWDINFA